VSPPEAERDTPRSRATLALGDSAATVTLARGELFAGYRIEEVIARGGMGVVHRATQLRPQRTVALKVLAPELSAAEGFRRRFRREAELAAAIEHPNVVPVYEVGEADGLLYISMRYVEGTDLERLAVDPLEPRRAGRLVYQVGTALDAAHARGLVHRDVKPANVLISNADGAEHAYLSDFGVARRVLSQTAATRPGEWVGTADYMAPEAFEGGRVDARSDTYSLACVLYRALTGEVPYPRDLDLKTMYAHLHEPPPSARSRISSVPAELDAVLERGMAKDPERRYRSAGDLGAAALAAVGAPTRALSERSVAVGEAAARPGRAARRRRALGGAAVALALGSIGVAAWQLLKDETPPPPVPVVGSPIPVGDGPVSVAASDEVVWVANAIDDTVSAVDPVTGRRLGRPIPVGDEPGGVATGARSTWVVTVDEGAVTPIDAERLRAGSPIAAGSRPTDVAIGLGAVWVSVYDDDRVVRVEAGGETERIPVGDGPTDVAVGEGFVWVVNSEDDTMTKINATTREPVGSAIPVNNAPESVTVGAGSVWVANIRNDSVTRVDPVRGQSGPSIPVGERPDDIAVGEGFVWVANFDAGTVSRIDPESGRVVGEPIEIGNGPGALSIGAGSVWVTAFGADAVVPVEP